MGVYVRAVCHDRTAGRQSRGTQSSGNADSATGRSSHRYVRAPGDPRGAGTALTGIVVCLVHRTLTSKSGIVQNASGWDEGKRVWVRPECRAAFVDCGRWSSCVAHTPSAWQGGGIIKLAQPAFILWEIDRIEYPLPSEKEKGPK